MKSVTEANGKPPAAAENPLPMFYSRPEPLNPARHGSLSLIERPDYSFARNAHAIPVIANEMPSAMRSYPIVFVGPHKMPVAITGLRKDENLFVEADGRWAQPHYVPAYVRRYPFVLAGDSKADRLTLCIDRDSSRVVEAAEAPLAGDGAGAMPLFEGQEVSEATKRALDFCREFQTGINATRAMAARLEGLGLFAERKSTVTLEGGEVLNLTDFQVVDEAALNKLGNDDFLDLRRSGALALVYCHLASMNSWPSLVHQARNRKER